LIAEIIGFIAAIGFFGAPTLSPSAFANGKFVGTAVVTAIIFGLYYLLILPIGIGFLSHAYRYFFRPR
jgi:predicted secreted protein